jgi:hypothetical protein
MLLLGTLIDVTSQKKAQANPQDQEGQLSADQSAQIAPLLQQIGNIVRRLSKSLQPVNLSQMDRVAVQECFVAIEHMKMLIAELEILRIGQD